MKKNLLTLALLGVLALGLSGCLGVPKEEAMDDEEEMTVTDEPEVMEEEELSVPEMIEDFESYVDSDLDNILICPEELTDSVAFVDNAEKGGIKELTLLDSDEYGLTLYLTANPDGVDTKTFEDTVNKCIDGVGMNGPLKAYDDYLLWGNPMCSSGFAPTEDMPGYDDFQNCVEISEDILKYFGLDEAMEEPASNDEDDAVAFKCPAEGATVDCEPTIGEGGAQKAAYCEWVQENCSGVVLAL